MFESFTIIVCWGFDGGAGSVTCGWQLAITLLVASSWRKNEEPFLLGDRPGQGLALGNAF